MDAPCFCPCHVHPGTYFAEPCSVCGHYDSRDTVSGWEGRGGWREQSDEYWDGVAARTKARFIELLREQNPEHPFVRAHDAKHNRQPPPHEN